MDAGTAGCGQVPLQQSKQGWRSAPPRHSCRPPHLTALPAATCPPPPQHCCRAGTRFMPSYIPEASDQPVDGSGIDKFETAAHDTAVAQQDVTYGLLLRARPGQDAAQDAQQQGQQQQQGQAATAAAADRGSDAAKLKCAWLHSCQQAMPCSRCPRMLGCQPSAAAACTAICYCAAAFALPWPARCRHSVLQGGAGVVAPRGRPGCLLFNASGPIWHGPAAVRAWAGMGRPGRRVDVWVGGSLLMGSLAVQ